MLRRRHHRTLTICVNVRVFFAVLGDGNDGANRITSENELVQYVHFQIEMGVMNRHGQLMHFVLEDVFVRVLVICDFVSDLLDASAEVCRGHHIPLWRILEVINRALPFPEGGQSVKQSEGIMLLERHRLEAIVGKPSGDEERRSYGAGQSLF